MVLLEVCTWLPSFADTSAMLFLLAWCKVNAALVAPPATPTIDWKKYHNKFINTYKRTGTSCMTL